jgi:hypothetical protein
MDKKNKPIGFLQENFHSEVLDFLFELFSHVNNNQELILYNDLDKYDNKSNYLKKYKNLSVKSLDYFIPDLTNKHCEKIIIVSYDNIIHLNLLSTYKNELLFVSHSKKHVIELETLGLNYFSLTPLLSKIHMLPIVKNIYNTTKNPNYNILNIDILNDIKSKKSKFEIILMIGYFLKNNKNIELVRQLMLSNNVILILFIPEVTIEVKTLINEFPDKIFAAVNLPSEQIQYNIEFLDVKYILFSPLKDSVFYKESWSGSIAFGFNNDLCLIMPESLAIMYNINNNALITYTNNDPIFDSKNIIEKLNNNNHFDYILELQKTRNQIFDQNCLMLNRLINTNYNYTTFHYGEIILESNDFDCKNTLESNDFDCKNTLESNDFDCKNTSISNNLDCKFFINFVHQNNIDINNTLIIDTNPDLGNFGLQILDSYDKCTIYNFEKNIEKAKLQKQSYTINGHVNRFKIYNNYVGDMLKSNVKINEITLDMFTIDSFSFDKKTSVIKIDSDFQNDILTGSLNTINKYKPIIIITNVKGGLLQNSILVDIGYNYLHNNNCVLYY